MPMIVFGKGMFNADNVVKFKGHIAGIVNIIWKKSNEESAMAS